MEHALTEKTGKGRSPILLVILGFCAILCNGFATYKFVPIISALMSYWGVGEGLIGTLQSSNAIASIAFLIPVGFLLRRWKPRWSGTFGAGLLVFGNLLGYFAPNFVLLIVSRVIEGLGAVTLNNMVHNIVQNHFDNEHRGRPLGIMNMGQYGGQFLHLLLAELLVSQFGWQIVYLYMCAFQLLFGIVWFIFANDTVTILGIKGKSAALAALKNAEAESRETEQKSDGALKVIAKLLKNKSFILLCLATAMYNPAIIQFGSYIKTYLQTVRGMTSQAATAVYLVHTICGCIAMFVGGTLSDLLKTRRKIAYVTTRLMAMVKAASYGAGKVEVASALQWRGIDYLTVAYADEGVELRRGGITVPIMVMNPEAQRILSLMTAAMTVSPRCWKNLALYK